MDVIGFIFGISGMSFGIMGYIFSVSALNKIAEHEERLNKISPVEIDS